MVSAPGDVAVRSAFGPRVFMSVRDLEETHLLGLGARARYEAYVKLPARAPMRSACPIGTRRRWPRSASTCAVSDQDATWTATWDGSAATWAWSR